MNHLMVSPKVSDSKISSELRPFVEVLLGGTCEEILSNLFEATQSVEAVRLRKFESERKFT
jgi:hypothetical protein